MLCMPFQTEIYRGKYTFRDENQKKLSVGASAVKRLSQCLKSESHIFKDCNFTTIWDSFLS